MKQQESKLLATALSILTTTCDRLLVNGIFQWIHQRHHKSLITNIKDTSGKGRIGKLAAITAKTNTFT